MECTRLLPHSSGIFRLRDVKLQFESNYNRCCDEQAAIGYRTRDSDANDFIDGRGTGDGMRRIS